MKAPLIKVRQYKEINSEQLEGVFEKMIHLVSVINDLDPLDVQGWKAKKVIEAYNVAQKKVRLSDRYKEQIEIGGSELKLIGFSQLTLGQFINLEEYVNERFEQNISKIAATIYLMMSGGGMFDLEIEDYSKVNIEYRSELIDELPINSILGACKKYLSFRDTFFNSYELFSDPFEGVVYSELSEEEQQEYDNEMKEREKQGSNQWLTMLNILSDNDMTKFDEILKRNLFLAFNQLSWLKSNK